MALGLFAGTGSGEKVVKNQMLGVLPVVILTAIISLAFRLMGAGQSLLGMVGMIIIVMLPVGILSSRIMWKKGIITVVDSTGK